MIANKVTNRIIAVRYEPKKQYRAGYQKTKRWYNRKNTRAKVKIALYAAAAIDYASVQNLSYYFLTLTTRQHQTGAADVQLWKKFGYFCNQILKAINITVVERQRNTGDLHFHSILLHNKIDIQLACTTWCEILGLPFNPAALDIKQIETNNIQNVLHYVNSYMVKKGDYESLFQCRTFNVSRKLSTYYKQNADRYICKIPKEVAHLYIDEFKLIKSTDFFNVFEFNQNVWSHLQHIRDNYRLSVEQGEADQNEAR